MAAARKPDQAIAQALGIARQTAALWRGRFAEHGIAGIEKDAPRSGRPRVILPAKIDEVLSKNTRETPADAPHWSTRGLAAVNGIRPVTGGRIWRAHGLKPHPGKA